MGQRTYVQAITVTGTAVSYGAVTALTGEGLYVETAALSANTNDQVTLTLGRTGGLSSVVSSVFDLPEGARVASAQVYDANLTQINLTVTTLGGGATDLPNRGVLFFQLPTGLPTDATTFSISVNGQTPRPYHNSTGSLLAGSNLRVGNRTSIVRLGDRYYTADSVEAQDALVSAAYASRLLSFTRAGGNVDTVPLNMSVFHGAAAVAGHTDSFTSNESFQFGDYAAAGTRLFIEARTTGGTVGPTTIATSTGFLRLPLLTAANILDNSALSADTPAAGDVLTFMAAGNVWAPPTPVGGDGTVSAADPRAGGEHD